jgi:hypothetical protein
MPLFSCADNIKFLRSRPAESKAIPVTGHGGL